MKKGLKIFLIFLGILLIGGGVACAIIFSLPKKEKPADETDKSSLLALRPFNSDFWTDEGNFAIGVDGENISGKGINSDPYKIYTTKGLAYFAHAVNSGSSTFSNTYIEIENDLDLSNHYWVSIGSQTESSVPVFEGNFDGKGHSIYGYFFNNNNEFVNGLFGNVRNATIKNIQIRTGGGYSSGSSFEVENFGIIAGQVSNSVISNCQNYIVTNLEATNLGGIVGKSNSSTFDGCINYGVRFGRNKSAVGGIVGLASGDCVVKNCYNYADISSGLFLGGLVGKSESGKLVVSSSFNLGNVGSYDNAGQGSVAGLVGLATSSLEISESYNGGELENSENTSNVSGIANCTISSSASVKLSNAVNFGKVDEDIQNYHSILRLERGEHEVAITFEGCKSESDLATNIITTGHTKEENLEKKMREIKFLQDKANWANEIAWSEFILSDAHYPISKSNVPKNWSSHIEKMAGEGSKENPYLISSAQNLGYLSALCEVENTNDKYFKITKNIDLAGYEFLPINNFGGIIDGGNFEISNLKILPNICDEVGLFGKISSKSSVKIENIKLKNVDILSNSVVAGMLIGKVESDTTILNCKASGNILVKSRNETSIGGLVGQANGAQNLNISKCEVEGRLKGEDFVGGILGENSFIQNYSIESCKFKGQLEGELVGGIVSKSFACDFGNVRLNFVDLEIKAEKAGGIVGEINKSSAEVATIITENAVKGVIEVSNGGVAAGVVGLNKQKSDLSKNSIILKIKVPSKMTANLYELFGSSSVVPDNREGSYAHIEYIDRDGKFNEIKKLYLNANSNAQEVFKDYFIFKEFSSMPVPKGICGQGSDAKSVDAFKLLYNKGFVR